MNKILISVIIGFIAIIVLVEGVSISNQDKNVEVTQPVDENIVENNDEVDSNPANTTYIIEGQPVTLVNGESIQEIPDSSSSIETKIWTTTEGNLNDDTNMDAAVIIEQNTGGTGIFYYVAGSINEPNGFIGTNAEYLGDRIAMQTLEVRDMNIIVNYADRAEEDSMADSPSVGVSKYYKVEKPNVLVEIDNPN